MTLTITAFTAKKIDDVTKRITSLYDVFRELNLSGEVVSISMHEGIQTEINFIADLIKYRLLAKALNEGWEPNWDNADEPKYYPYFDMRTKSFSLSDVSYRYEYSIVPSRLCFRSRALAEHAVKHFPDLIKSLFTK